MKGETPSFALRLTAVSSVVTAQVSKPVISMFGSGVMTSVPDSVSAHTDDASSGVSPVARSLAPFPVPDVPHSVTFTVTVSSTITTGTTTAGRKRALRVDRGRQGSPARGRPNTHVLRPTGGMPRGHPKVDRGGLGGGPMAASTPTAHAAVCKRRTNVLARGGSTVGIPGAGPAGRAPPDLRISGSSRVAAAPDKGGDVQAAPWSSSSAVMGVAIAPPARWM